MLPLARPMLAFPRQRPASPSVVPHATRKPGRKNLEGLAGVGLQYCHGRLGLPDYERLAIGRLVGDARRHHLCHFPAPVQGLKGFRVARAQG